jgi:hypothetical protein
VSADLIPSRALLRTPADARATFDPTAVYRTNGVGTAHALGLESGPDTVLTMLPQPYDSATGKVVDVTTAEPIEVSPHPRAHPPEQDDHKLPLGGPVAAAGRGVPRRLDRVAADVDRRRDAGR